MVPHFLFFACNVLPLPAAEEGRQEKKNRPRYAMQLAEFQMAVFHGCRIACLL